MKMMLGNTPVKSLNIHHFEMDTNSATVQPSDLQAGITCFARGQKVTGTGRCFSFANYGTTKTNVNTYVPSDINVIEISSLEYPIKLTFELTSLKNLDFSIGQNIATVVIDSVEHNLNVSVKSNMLLISCDETFNLQVFYGKDNYA